MEMTKIKIDGEEIEVPKHYTLLQACEAAGREVPRFCYHDRLSIAGNCRMCLVEVKGGPPKPQASCALGVGDLRPGPEGEPPEVFTTTPMVKKAREGVMQFMLINHPLDCPICDQGGECDLQDQAIAYGYDKSRFGENKRSVEEKYLGPLVKTSMTRCIHCTRCVRFITEVAGVADLGATGRGEEMEITTYLEAAMSSEMQGNVIDLCPVGALTSAPFAFTARAWELKKTESIDVIDAVGSAIQLECRGREVMRITPRLNEAVNEEWLADRSRFIWDGLKSQRLDTPYMRRDGRLHPTSWQQAFESIAQKVTESSAEKIAALAGDMASVEEMFALKKFMLSLKAGHMDCRQDGSLLDNRHGRAGYLFNPGIEAIEQADAVLIIGANPRLEAPILNARIRKAWRLNGAEIALVGSAVDLTYPYAHLGDNPQILTEIAAGKHGFAEILKNAQKPLIIIGATPLTRQDGQVIYNLGVQIAQLAGALSEDWNGFGILHTAASRIGGLDIGFMPQEGCAGTVEMLEMARTGGLDILFNLGADEVDFSNITDCLHVYIGSHGDAGAQAADIILPAAAYSEKSGIYVNMEGRVQQSSRAVFPPGEAREDWRIIRALSGALDIPLPFDDLAQLRAALFEEFPHFQQTGHIESADVNPLKAVTSEGDAVSEAPLEAMTRGHYLVNPILRASVVMAECQRLADGAFKQAAE